MTAKTYVLIHGGFHGGWCWQLVAKRLRALGHDVFTPTNTGLGERSHLMSVRPDMELFATDLVQMFHYEDIRDAIVVGHSFGGSAVSVLADRLPERVRHLVYLDAMLLQSGQCPADLSPPGHIDRYAASAVDTPGGKVLLPVDPERFGITDPKVAGWTKSRLTPQPLQTFMDRLHLEHPLGNGKPGTYICCTAPLWGSTGASRDLARRMPGWAWREIACGHDAMLIKPDELTDMLDAIG